MVLGLKTKVIVVDSVVSVDVEDTEVILMLPAYAGENNTIPQTETGIGGNAYRNTNKRMNGSYSFLRNERKDPADKPEKIPNPLNPNPERFSFPQQPLALFF